MEGRMITGSMLIVVGMIMIAIPFVEIFPLYLDMRPTQQHYIIYQGDTLTIDLSLEYEGSAVPVKARWSHWHESYPLPTGVSSTWSPTEIEFTYRYQTVPIELTLTVASDAPLVSNHTIVAVWNLEGYGDINVWIGHLTIKSTIKPDFSYTPTTPEAGETISFSDASIPSEGYQVNEWKWDFNNDGVIDSTSQNPSHSYAEAGTYSVKLWVKDTRGASGEIVKEIVVLPKKVPPVASFTYSPSNPIVGESVYFDATASYDPDGGVITQYNWDMNNDGVIDAQGAQVSWTYNTTGSYIVNLTVIDDEGSSSIASLGVVVAEYSPPVADFTYSPTKPVINQTVAFTDKSQASTLLTYEWDLNGDGTTDSRLRHPSYTYTQARTYSVRLTITDARGGSDSIVKTITVYEVAPNQPPVADFEYSPTTNITTTTRIIFANKSYDPDGSIVAYYWDFGDGKTSREKNPTHIYNQPGTYNIILTVRDDKGDNSSTTKTITVSIQKFTLSGKVIDKDAKPIEGVAVYVDGVLVATTDANGYYSAEIEEGAHAITFSKSGYQTTTTTITLSQNTTLNIQLSPHIIKAYLPIFGSIMVISGVVLVFSKSLRRYIYYR